MKADIGMLFLGAFVGGTITLGIYKTTDWSKLGKLFGVVFGAAFSGVVFAFMQFSNRYMPIGDAIFMYPVGLLNGMLWVYIRDGMANYRESREKKDSLLLKLVFLHFAGVVLVSLLAIGMIVYSETKRPEVSDTAKHLPLPALKG